MDKRQMKIELTSAARRGIEEFFKTTRGENMFGAKAEIILIDSRTMHIKAQPAGGTAYFTLHIKEGTSDVR